MVPHRLSRWFLIVLVAMIAFPINLLALGQTPASGDTQLFIGHAARLTAQIPAAWNPLPDSGFTYSAGDKSHFVSSQPVLESTLAEACDAAAFDPSLEDITFTNTTWNSKPACEIEASKSLLNHLPMKGLILPHPDPYNFQGETVSFVIVFMSPEYFDTIIPTISFDLSRLTGPEIAHSLLDVVEVNSYYADDIDWSELRSAADDLDSPDDVAKFINAQVLRALRAAGDNHSFLMPDIDPGAGGGTPFRGGYPSGEMRGNLGYIEIPSGALPGDTMPYIETGIDVVAELAPQACGWIVDLRGNTGGSVPIMVQPLLPFSPEGRLFGFDDGSGEQSWVLRKGDRMVMDEGNGAFQYGPPAETPLPELANPDAPIAVLIGDDTISAGEYTLLTLSGRETTRSFGQSTGGYTTGNAVFPMLDGTALALAGAAAIDMDGNVYTGKIEPDEPIFSQARGGAQGQDDTILAAETWLLQQPAYQDAATPVN